MAEALHAFLNQLEAPALREALLRCCHSRRWVEAMSAARPFASTDALLAQAEATWQQLDASDYLEAFSGHPEIGAKPAPSGNELAPTADWSSAEQAGMNEAEAYVKAALLSGNQAYRARFGYIFIVCATGKSSTEMLSLLEARLGNDPKTELTIAAAEQAKITRLRLLKLAPSLAIAP